EPEGRLLYNHRPLRQIHYGKVVDSVGVRCKEQRFRVHELRENYDRVILGADALKALTYSVGRRAAEAVVERVKRSGEIHRVVNLLGCLGAGRSVREIERADASLDGVGRRYRFGDRRLRLRPGYAGKE